MTIEVWPDRENDAYTGAVTILTGSVELTDELKVPAHLLYDLREALSSAIAEIEANTERGE